MAFLAVQDGSAGVANVTLVAAAGGGDTVVSGYRAGNHDLSFTLVVKNTDATSTDVTVPGYTTAFTVPATTGFALIPLFGGYYQSFKNITYSKVTGLTVGLVRFHAAS